MRRDGPMGRSTTEACSIEALGGLDHIESSVTRLRAGRTRINCGTLTIAYIRTKLSRRATLTGCPDHYESDQKLQFI